MTLTVYALLSITAILAVAAMYVTRDDAAVYVAQDNTNDA